MKLAAVESPGNRQEEFGQFLTAISVADFIASIFGLLPSKVRLQDADAGAHSLRTSLVVGLL